MGCRRGWRPTGHHKSQGVVHTGETSRSTRRADLGEGAMALLDRFRTIRDTDDLAEFIDHEAEDIGRSVVEAYLRGRAGRAARELFAAPKFLAARDRAQHEAYAVALAMIGDMLAGEFAAEAAQVPSDLARGLAAVITASFDRRAPLLAGAEWAKAREELVHGLDAVASEQPKRVAAVAAAFAPSFLALMPIHDRLSADDFPALRRQIEAALGNVRGGFVRRASARRVLAALTAAGHVPEQ